MKTHISVFTPTYNRAYILENLYQSLEKQTFKGFEWIIIDDGSTDNTRELVDRFICQSSFPITYECVENGGKHRAINRGVKIARGDIFFIVDSDDYLVDDALALIDQTEKTIPIEDKQQYAGVCGLRGYSIDTMIGTTFEGDRLDITMLDREDNGISGDKAEAFYTSVLRKYPFPEIDGETFITECIVWDQIAFDGYKLRFFNSIIYICNYLEDGLTNNEQAILLKNPVGYGLELYQSRTFGKIKGKNKWDRNHAYYTMFRGKLSFKTIANNLHYNPIFFGMGMIILSVYNRLFDH